MTEVRAILSIDKCPTHGFYAICLGDENSGTRLTSSKCCGRWENVKKWFLSAKELREMASKLSLEADYVDELATTTVPNVVATTPREGV